MNEGPTCESLWLPPCPACSQVAYWRAAALDLLEAPSFYLARCTSAQYGQNYFLLRGCTHANALYAHPCRNRLWLAVRWRRQCEKLVQPLFRHGYTDAQRAAVLVRLGHPSQYEPANLGVRTPAPTTSPVFQELGRQLRQPYADD